MTTVTNINKQPAVVNSLRKPGCSFPTSLLRRTALPDNVMRNGCTKQIDCGLFEFLKKEKPAQPLPAGGVGNWRMHLFNESGSRVLVQESLIERAGQNVP